MEKFWKVALESLLKVLTSHFVENVIKAILAGGFLSVLIAPAKEFYFWVPKSLLLFAFLIATSASIWLFIKNKRLAQKSASLEAESKKSPILAKAEFIKRNFQYKGAYWDVSLSQEGSKLTLLRVDGPKCLICQTLLDSNQFGMGADCPREKCSGKRFTAHPEQTKNNVGKIALRDFQEEPTRFIKLS